MSNTVIKVNGLGKCYRIGAKQRKDRTFREVIIDAVKAPITNFTRLKKLTRFEDIKTSKTDDIIWALREVSFEIKEGEAVGIIGRNGAGKSTLLKILSRITEPTTGYAEIDGKISSLLEVGTGFHPELTGRENIYLNGSILGMRKWEIDKQFDEIVAFSEIEKFIDTPVKHYSSGMYVRLAFAVAAHMNPDILIVDEVLAVGDEAFQKKCFRKMSKVGESGRTVLFVSHNMSAVTNLCGRVIILDLGKILDSGLPSAMVRRYYSVNMNSDKAFVSLSDYRDRKGTGLARIVSATLNNQNGESTTTFSMGETLKLVFNVSIKQPIGPIKVSVDIKNINGINIFHLADDDSDVVPFIKGNQDVSCVMSLPSLDLYPGRYLLSIWVGDTVYRDHDYVIDCMSFSVVESKFVKRKTKLYSSSGIVYKRSFWSVEYIDLD